MRLGSNCHHLLQHPADHSKGIRPAKWPAGLHPASAHRSFTLGRCCRDESNERQYAAQSRVQQCPALQCRRTMEQAAFNWVTAVHWLRMTHDYPQNALGPRAHNKKMITALSGKSRVKDGGCSP